jgi:thermitase
MLRPILLRRALAMLALLCTIFLGTAASAQGSQPRHWYEGLGPEPPPFVPGRILVQFRADVPAQQVRNLIAAARAQWLGEIPQIGVHVLQLPPSASEAAVARAFGQRPEVVFAELDEILAPGEVKPNDYYYSRQWHLPKIGASIAWETSTGRQEVIIAILDTGVDGNHPDLASKMVPGWNVYNNNADSSDVYGHGTMVAGTTAAATNNTSGVASVAWNCKIMPIRISDANGYATYSAMASGLTWAADHGARVANISYIASDSATVASAAKYFQSKGGVVTVSAGNNGAFNASGDNPYVLTVSATDSNDMLASWSNTGNNIDLAAPGVYIYTTKRGGQYGAPSGTSFSAPIVAGAAALVISVRPDLTPSQVQDILKQSADDLGVAGWDSQYGWGRVNVARAVNLALSSAGGMTDEQGADTVAPTITILSPSDGDTVAKNVQVKVDAVDNVAVVKVELYVDGKLTSTSTSAPFTVSWNPRKAANGLHTLQCKAYDAAGNIGASQVVTVYK